MSEPTNPGIIPKAITGSAEQEDLPFLKDPELVFGLVGPVGVDLEFVTEVLGDSLASVGYEARTIRITELMREVNVGLPLDDGGYIASFKQRIAYANKVREVLQRNDALAIMAVSAIRQFRAEQGGNEEEPLPKQAYIIRQLKRPEEIKLLRSVYGTTFPCHICAKHIVASGILRVVYIEPYPKSYAEELHADSIAIEGDGKDGRVAFQRFIGISPYRYRELFEKGKRKYSSGSAQKWNRGEMRPMIEVIYPSYFKSEARAVALLVNKIEAFVKA